MPPQQPAGAAAIMNGDPDAQAGGRSAQKTPPLQTASGITPPTTKTSSERKRTLAEMSSTADAARAPATHARSKSESSRDVINNLRSANSKDKASSKAARPRSGDSTPVSASPSRKKQKIYGDRFIPNREGVDLHASYNLINNESSPSAKRAPNNELHYQRKQFSDRLYADVIRAELFEGTVPQRSTLMSPSTTHSTSTRIHDPTRSSTPPPVSSEYGSPSTPHRGSNMFNYMSPSMATGLGTPSRTPRRGQPNLDTTAQVYSLSPIRMASQKMLLSPRAKQRVVSKAPYKVLDAPDLADDFYLNLVDWGSNNILGVGLGSCVYMWSADSQRVTKLCELEDDTVTSVSWIQRGHHIAIGTQKGTVQIWDASRTRRLRTMMGHGARVGALAWNEHILTSGSRDRLIYHRDVRQPDQWTTKLTHHKQEVCGLRWSEDGMLASGGNDNKLMVWDKLHDQPLYKFDAHQAAVKAIAWSPHQKGLLASGGGTACRKIMFHNTLTGDLLSETDTGSQVCNLAWSKNSNELVSTHGYQQNQIVLWKYPSMQQVVSLTGHTYRVLYLAMSPDGKVIVTGAGDETLRFWNAFPKSRGNYKLGGDLDSLGSSRLGEYSLIR